MKCIALFLLVLTLTAGCGIDTIQEEIRRLDDQKPSITELGKVVTIQDVQSVKIGGLGTVIVRSQGDIFLKTLVSPLRQIPIGTTVTLSIVSFAPQVSDTVMDTTRFFIITD